MATKKIEKIPPAKRRGWGAKRRRDYLEKERIEREQQEAEVRLKAPISHPTRYAGIDEGHTLAVISDSNLSRPLWGKKIPPGLDISLVLSHLEAFQEYQRDEEQMRENSS